MKKHFVWVLNTLVATVTITLILTQVWTIPAIDAINQNFVAEAAA